jgi:hypothetical protein
LKKRCNPRFPDCILTKAAILLEHDVFGKPVPTFPDHALAGDASPILRQVFCVAAGAGKFNAEAKA